MQEVVQPICLALKSFQPLLVPKLGYSQLAVMAYGEKRKLFKLRPKVHMYHEIFEYLDCDSPISLSPMTAATWSDEDFIGRVSRVARSGHGACVSITCIKKCLGLYQRHFQNIKQKCRRGAR